MLDPVGARKRASSKLDFDDDPQMAVIEFASPSYAVLEREQRVTVEVVRYGITNTEIRFR